LDEEQNLITLSISGDVQAYERLVHRYEQIAFRAAWLITRDPHEAADAAQDAFLRAHRALHTFKPGLPFRPWLLRIVTNQALNRVKAIQRRTQMAERYAERVMMNQPELEPDRTLAESEQSERLLKAVARLAADEQLLLSLRYFLELPEKEVAETLGVPLGTVKSRLSRTLTRLRDIIRREFPDLSDLNG
jgi:RNA polymerase sigma-70 factor (ECF subfamily)